MSVCIYIYIYVYIYIYIKTDRPTPKASSQSYKRNGLPTLSTLKLQYLNAPDICASFHCFIDSVTGSWSVISAHTNKYQYIYIYIYTHTHIYMGMCVCVCVCTYSKVKLATIVEGDPKAPFSIATTPSCREGHYSFPRISPHYPWSVPYNAKG